MWVVFIFLVCEINICFVCLFLIDIWKMLLGVYLLLMSGVFVVYGIKNSRFCLCIKGNLVKVIGVCILFMIVNKFGFWENCWRL